MPSQNINPTLTRKDTISLITSRKSVSFHLVSTRNTRSSHHCVNFQIDKSGRFNEANRSTLKMELVLESKMNPWIVDAKDIQLEDIEDFKGTLFQTNTKIQSFVSKKKGPELLISGPKGFGKTLLLKLKKDLLRGTGVQLLPENHTVDRPIGTPPIFSMKDNQDLLEDEQYWKSIWLLAISVTLLKSHYEIDDYKKELVAIKSDSLRGLILNPKMVSACDLFDSFLRLSRKEYLLSYGDFGSFLTPELRSIHSPMAYFIDNVDEYFEHALAFRDNAAVSKNIAHSFWTNAQLGLANAAREINGINSHLKIYATIRREVVQSAQKRNPLGLQLRGSTVELSYEKDDLIEVLRKNILAEQDDLLAEPRNRDELAAFFGPSNLQIEHRYTNEDEPVEDFLVRHTLLRPRDIAVLGGSVSDIPPSRRTISTIRETVNTESASVAESYLAEARPHIANFNDEALFKLLSSNVISSKKVSEISDEYDRRIALLEGVEQTERHVFCDLYRLGLLGYVFSSKKTEPKVQKFAQVGSVPVKPKRCMPKASTYLVHPILYDYIGRFNPDFLSKINSLNIVGNGRPWREFNDVCFVIKGDIAKYSEIMADADLADSFPSFFEEIVGSACRNLMHYRIEGGDSLVVVDRNSINVISAFEEINSALESSVFQRRLRAGGDAGIIRYDYKNEKPTDFRGGAFRTAGRLEPVGIPGELVVTERFKDFAGRFEGCSFTRLTADELPKARSMGGRFDLAKNETEESIIETLYRAEGKN